MKPVYTSKTLLFNIGILLLARALLEIIEPTMLVATIAVANMILRGLTCEKIRISI